jgi:glycosyltransferase involved in cell wall biosynthesis
MRILLVSNTPFLPPTAGNRSRIAQMVGFLQRHGVEVGMLMLPAADVLDWDLDGMRGRLSYFELAQPPRGGRVIDRIRRSLRRPRSASTDAIGVDDWCPRWFRDRVATAAERWGADVLLIEYVFLSACLLPVGTRPGPRPVTVIDTHDIMQHRPAAYAAAGLDPRWFYTTRDEERRGLLRADVVLAIREEDARTLRDMLPDREVLIVPHGHDVRAAAPQDALPDRVLFVASHNDLNVRGLQWFFAEVWPQVRAAAAGADLSVCGTVAEKLDRVPAGVVVRGVVPSLAAEYAAARLAINPVQGATGLQIKVVEALCHGRPVVSTSAGTAGIGPDPDGGVLIADTAADFAAAVGRVLCDGECYRRLAADAAQHAARCFTPDAAFSPLLAHLTGAVARRRPGAPAAPP